LAGVPKEKAKEEYNKVRTAMPEYNKSHKRTEKNRRRADMTCTCEGWAWIRP